ncbi:response regulator transcription factor [Aquabacterium lacunae]|jgi:two-component system, NarL family, invasion response regulator UvrY|uniref:Response regulator transcription factor n=1 Tax=Aquabacterium lacunae TaxID=2528630 RepID=A0A4Q9GYS7_9BURK|nr:response regulator transcription factor [Aquabacterium lacunae]TBO31140.1 response regulator transcription factor [Aquabacterium lacunae]
MIRVLLVDDHRIVRQGLRQVLADVPDIEVVGDAGDGAQALSQVRSLVCTPEGLQVVMLDIAMPGRDGLEVLKLIKAEFPRLAVLMLSTYPDRQFAVRCLRAGAAGYLHKSADPDDMVAALRKAAAGGRYITPSVAELLATSISEPHDHAPHEALSQREHQVFRLLAQGHSVGQIAQSLSLSSNTVSTYRARILEKTGTRNDVELALYAVRQQMVEP